MNFEDLFNNTVIFKDNELLEYEKGYIRFKTVVNETNTNPYGNAHGGYLYTLCDNLAGLVGYSLGYYVVTLQANINYLKAGKLNDELYITGRSIHPGKSTDVVEIDIRNKDDDLLVKAEFTLFNIGKVDEK